MILDGIKTYHHSWYLISLENSKLVYTNEPNETTYRNRSNSLFNVYTLTLSFSGDHIKSPDAAVITVNSSSHAIEQEIHNFYYNDLEDLKSHIEKLHLPSHLGV